MFGRKRQEKDPKETAKEVKKTTRQGEREISREINSLDREEKRLVAEIKKTARTGNQGATKVLAKQLVRLRAQRGRMYGARATVAAVGHQATAMRTQLAVAGAVGNMAGALRQMNAQMDPTRQQAVLQEFARQAEIANVREEMLDDALTDALDGEGVEEGADEVVSSVLASIGLDLDAQMIAAPSGGQGVATTERQETGEATVASNEDAQAEALLKELAGLEAL
mmetsp:Transcript_34397/g.62810  ORF Transcript_34397/g.62810 Transcript_34397/m.62810 type:complete len:224 (+) Transcript_34397:165-836(+)